MAQPCYPLRHTALADPSCFGWLLGDHDGLSRLAARLSFAACSRHTIVTGCPWTVGTSTPPATWTGGRPVVQCRIKRRPRCRIGLR
ncbi:hypothetical protein ACIOZL_27695 [Streptomyces sp. NPDC087769]|uniref:hypothetical protein n=1 Tax=unclassified Streptomyces TaxID=2593676 RepID=UPI003719E811